jgi:hypothetical protein
MKLPPTIAIKDLTPTHAEYDAKHLGACHSLYHGGKLFRENLDDFLIKRKIEDTDNKHYELRKRRSFYVPYAAGLLDWISAAAFKDGVELRVLSGSSEAREYYEGLNGDADGHGTPLNAVLTSGLLHAMIFGRSYFFPDFEYPMQLRSNPKTGDARIVLMEPMMVDDWDKDEDGFLRWARMHAEENLRDANALYKQPTEKRNVWTFFDEEGIYIYEAITKKGQRAPTVATLIDTRANGLGTCPLFEVYSPENIWVMDRIYEVAVALFNREASLTWALDMSAYATLVLTIDATQINQIVATELAALRLRPGESASYISPPGGIYEPLFKDADRLKQNLYEVVRSLGIDAAKVPQAGRMSGETITKMREPLDILLESFSQPVLEAVARLLDAVRVKRGDEDVELELIMGDQDEEGEDGEEDGANGTDDEGDGEADGPADGAGEEVGAGGADDKGGPAKAK